ncbi:alcohol dehydrogenase catalytic domain-containing protein [Gloeobacter violaceus]|uniref:alcohol dehydrogenase n=1 Tax=Gloeobacter violaceus (strain ATCC 29082 / PCC 7421) TaxID=251221 RepID=Q7NCZ0_GLOVI|nr:alcohol dehydrogenase catalytic domain-containing protein [Gloeobacter violaceus]BAC90777.1 alcohol dehydrogenase [Gloeobacter violaceus PCC 7421]
MKAAVVPNLHGRWEIRDLPIPEPGINQVLIRIKASGLCYTDIHITEGAWPADSFPRTLGHEPVGEIVALGAGVRTRRLGDRVGVPWLQLACGRCEWCRRGKALFCKDQQGTGVQTQGGHAEYMLAQAEATVLLPDALAYEQAASLFCAGYTVWAGLRFADPKPHERVAVLGIGGLGHLAVQYGKAAGFETFAITHSPSKEKLVRSLGADGVFPSGAALREAGGADVILACSNSYRATGEALQGLRPDGRLVLMGLPSDNQTLAVSGDLLVNRWRIIGSQQNGPEHLFEALDYAAKGKVKVVAETYSLDEINLAFDRVFSGDVRFRAVIIP